MLNKWISKLIIATCAFSLSGCATHSNKAECGVAKGASCKSVTEVNKLVTTGELENSNEKFNKTKPKKLTLTVAENLFVKEEGALPLVKSFNIVSRAPEKTARVWINGFEDEMGDYVQETYIHTVVEEGRWVNVK